MLRRYFKHISNSFNSPTSLLNVSLIITTALLIAVIFYEFKSIQNLRHIINDDFKASQLRSVVENKQETSQIFVRMAVMTGDKQWKSRYIANQKILLKSIKSTELASDGIDLSNNEMNQLEAKAFALFDQGKLSAAEKIIFSPQYERIQKSYEDKLYQYDLALQTEIANHLQQTMLNTYYLTISILCVLTFLMIAWLVTTFNIRRLKMTKAKERLEELLYYDQVTEIHDRSLDGNTTPAAFLVIQKNREQFLNEVRIALEAEQFIIHYQPIVSIATQEVVEIEALLRWQHPVHGLLSPAAFLPLIESTEYMVPLGAWVLRTACKQLKKWQTLGHRKLSISVNLSARQLQDPDLLQLITDVLKTSGISPSSLKLEITETMIMHDINKNKELLQQIVNLGVQISLDDFGTGYSSLNYIKQFPISIIKIDRSFVSEMTMDITSIAIIESIIVLAKSLGLLIIAEGVETQTQLYALKKMKCDMFQGYLFSRPIPAEQIIALFNHNQPSENNVETLNECQPYQYIVMQQEHSAQAIEVITQSFCEHEPMTKYLGISSREFKPFAHLIVNKAIQDGLSIVALEGNKVAACTIVEDIANPLNITIDIDPRFKIIFSLLENLGNDFFLEKNIETGHLSHLFITAVAENYHGKGLSSKVNFESIKLASQKGFDFMCCEFTHEYNERGTIKNLKNSRLLIRSCRYKDYVYEGQKPFADLEGGASAYIWELRQGAKLRYTPKQEEVPLASL